MRTISIINTKGGCGKTTTAINLACCLGWKGLRVLLIDMDPQGHATLGVNYKAEQQPGLYELFTKQASIEQVIVKFVVAGIDIIPATSNLNKVDSISYTTESQGCLSNCLRSINYLYDYVIIDCPSVLSNITIHGMIASDGIIIPLDMSLFSFDSIKTVISKISEIEQRYTLNLPYSLLPTMVDQRTKLTRSFISKLWDQYPKQVLPFIIHNTVRIREAICKGLPIIDYDADSPAAMDYMYLADQIIREVNNDTMLEHQATENEQLDVQSVA